ncbi:MAG: hypothetical protein ABSA97_06805 [Verrucomicrobiia bacterium]
MANREVADYGAGSDLPLITVAGCYLLAMACWLAVDPTKRLSES